MKVIFPLSKFHYIHKPLNGFHYRTLEIYVTLFVTNMPLVPIIFDRNEVRQARLAQILMTYYPILSTAEPQHSARKDQSTFGVLSSVTVLSESTVVYGKQAVVRIFCF